MVKSAKTRKEIAKEYGVHPRTLRRWLKKEGIVLPRGLVRPVHQAIIYRQFGNPKSLEEFV